MSKYGNTSDAVHKDRDDPAQQPLVDMSSDILLHAKEGITRLTARARHAMGLANAGSVEIGEGVAVEDTLNTAGLINEQVQSLIHSHSLYELFKKPTSKLNREEEDLKRETLYNLTKLVDVDTELLIQNAGINERKDMINALNKEWMETCATLEKRMNDVPADEFSDSDEIPEKAAVVKFVNKMQILREILIRLIPAKTTYDFMEDEEGLLEVLATLREPFTLESILSDVMNSA